MIGYKGGVILRLMFVWERVEYIRGSAEPLNSFSSVL